jgi:ADP-heptose:LPS heptosyltransferase
VALQRILVVKRDKIGDMLLTTPLLAHLWEQLPDARIDVLCTDYNAWALDGNRDVDRRIVFPRGARAYVVQTVTDLQSEPDSAVLERVGALIGERETAAATS